MDQGTEENWARQIARDPSGYLLSKQKRLRAVSLRSVSFSPLELPLVPFFRALSDFLDNLRGKRLLRGLRYLSLRFFCTMFFNLEM